MATQMNDLTHLESPSLWHLRAYRTDGTHEDKWGTREAVDEVAEDYRDGVAVDGENGQVMNCNSWVTSCFVTPPKEAEPEPETVCDVCMGPYEDYYGECRLCHDRSVGLDRWGQA